MDAGDSYAQNMPVCHNVNFLKSSVTIFTNKCYFLTSTLKKMEADRCLSRCSRVTVHLLGTQFTKFMPNKNENDELSGMCHT